MVWEPPRRRLSAFMLRTSTATSALSKCFQAMVPGKRIINVLWKSVLCVMLLALATPALAQRDLTDSAHVPMQEAKPAMQVLDAIISAGGGPYKTIREGEYKMIFQPTGSLDLYMIPGGLIGFIFGGHFGYADRFTQGLSFGVRERLGFLSGTSYNTFTEISALFFDDKEFARSFETGLRLGLTTVWPMRGYGINVRLAGEYRGRTREESTGPLKHLYWVGLEGGVSFSLLREQRVVSRVYTIRSALRHILTSEEASEFESLPDDQVEGWYERYWVRKDLTPHTPLNEAREEFERRIQYANSAFAELKKLGTETDRGRVYVIYGRPDGIEIGNSTARQDVSYELWIYDNRLKTRATALFLFQAVGAGESYQIYSNVAGESRGNYPSTVPMHIYQILQRYK